jgi:hypothetical protein
MTGGQVFSEPHGDNHSSGEGQTPAVTARALKIVLYAGAALAMWGLYRLSGGGDASPESDALEVDTSETGSADDYSTWEPSQ